jgi:hypothetical protein
MILGHARTAVGMELSQTLSEVSGGRSCWAANPAHLARLVAGSEEGNSHLTDFTDSPYLALDVRETEDKKRLEGNDGVYLRIDEINRQLDDGTEKFQQ